MVSQTEEGVVGLTEDWKSNLKSVTPEIMAQVDNERRLLATRYTAMRLILGESEDPTVESVKVADSNEVELQGGIVVAGGAALNSEVVRDIDKLKVVDGDGVAEGRKMQRKMERTWKMQRQRKAKRTRK